MQAKGVIQALEYEKIPTTSEKDEEIGGENEDEIEEEKDEEKEEENEEETEEEKKRRQMRRVRN